MRGNVVKTQIWIAIGVYVLVAIVKELLKSELSLYTILQILSLTLCEKTHLDQLLDKAANENLEDTLLINCICLICDRTVVAQGILLK